jgi:hypothetical protein
MPADLTERYVDPPSGWPAAEELAERAAGVDLLLLPEEIRESERGNIAPFRADAQELRVVARENGLQAELVIPAEAQPAVYSEHAAEWVLPVILSLPAGVAVNLISTWIQGRLDKRKRGEPMPTLRYRQAELIDGQIRVRELEGHADAVIAVLGGQKPPPRVGHPTTLDTGDEAASDRGE